MKKLIIFLSLITILSSCKTLTPFTETIRQKNNLTLQDLKNIQFYTSNDILLNREINGSKNQIISGRIKTVNNRQIEEIFIPINTACLVVDTSKNGSIKLSFSDNDEKSLTFGVTQNTSRYVLLAESWNGKEGTVHYGSDIYITKGLSYDACLLVNMKELLKIKRKFKVEKGRKL